MATILIVDDSPSVRQLVRLVLEGAGYGVVEAENGQEGVAKAKSASFDLVITDLNMPIMNGLDLIRALRTMRSMVGVPIVFLSTESNDEAKQDAKAAGATGWITKPFKPEQLLAIANKLVMRK